MIDLTQYPYFGYDTETDGLNYPIDKAFGFSIATPDGKSEYYDIREEPNSITTLNKQMASYNGIIICHNASFDYRMSHCSEIFLPISRMDDTVIRATQINEHERSYSLDDLCTKYIKAEKVSTIYGDLAELYGGLATRNVQMPRLWQAPSTLVSSYAKKDALLCMRLWEWQQKEIEKQGIQAICKFERDRMPTFIHMEMRGVRVNLGYAEEAMRELSPLIERVQKNLDSIAGGEFNSNSSPQIKSLFEPKQDQSGNWFANDGTKIGTASSGGPSFKAEYLREMSHPAASAILEIRSLLKTRDTFLLKHVLGHSHRGRVYPSINQSKTETGGTGTGRLSIQNPALQQIPSRNKKVASIVKPCFLPDAGQVWVDGDMASFEVRIFAHLINNNEIIQAYHNNPALDLHQFVADISGLSRNATYSGEPNAKQLNLSMIFNSGDGAIAAKMGMKYTWTSFTTRMGEEVTYRKPGAEALAVIDKYHRRIPGVKELANGCKETAEERGYLCTYTGRRLRFPHGYKSYKASGILIQATSADRNKEHIGYIEEVLGEEGHLILNTHDSYSMSLPEDWKPWYKKIKDRIEQDEGKFRVPLIMDLNGVGENWWAALNN